MSGVEGAGPAEKREKDESPMNCGHSYWSKMLSPVFSEVFSVAFEASTVCPFRFERAINADKSSNRVKPAAKQRCFGFFTFRNEEKSRVKWIGNCMNCLFSTIGYKNNATINFTEMSI